MYCNEEVLKFYDFTKAANETKQLSLHFNKDHGK
jgi:hypothetical protein